MLSDEAITKLGQLLAESFPDFVMNDPKVFDDFIDFMTSASLSYVYQKLGSNIDSDLAVEISCALQSNIELKKSS
jgi:hypothetical protein